VPFSGFTIVAGNSLAGCLILIIRRTISAFDLPETRNKISLAALSTGNVNVTRHVFNLGT
jgi:hypothetical protein